MSLMEQEPMDGDLYIDPVFVEEQDWIWTLDSVKDESRAWVVNFYGGGCDYGYKDDRNCVRAVRSIKASE